MKIINFSDIASDFYLGPIDAIKYFRKKGLKGTFDWRDMLAEEHDAAFTVAKMMDTDLLKTVQDKLASALENGTTMAQFKAELIPELQKAGWWGKRDVIDPKTGRVVKAQLGSASRLETIFRTNMQSAYSVGRWLMIERNAKTAPYLMYDAVDDGRTRSEHAAQDNKVYPVTSPFWDEWHPPNGWNCRCGVVQLSADDLADYGLKVSNPPKIKRYVWKNPRNGQSHSIPEGIDPGFNYNPGKAPSPSKRRVGSLKELAAQKTADLPPIERVAVATANSVIAELQKTYLLELTVLLLSLGEELNVEDELL